MSERMEYQTGLWATIVRELKQLVSRPIYVLCMVGAPLFSCIFLLSLMHEGLPHKIPVAIVDHDHTSTSRNFIQQLGSQESVDVAYKLNSFTEARELMQSGDIFGFLIIPEDFEAKAIAGRQPEISFYTNDAPITILSRCQRYDFHRITIDTIAARLDELLKIEGVEAEEKAVRYVAKAGDGSMRDALSLLDQCIAFYLGQTLTYDKVLEVLGAVDTEVFSKLLRKVLQGDVTGAIRTLEDLIIGGRELGQFVGDFTWYMRNLLLVKTSENPEEAIDVSSENLKLLREESEMVDVETLMRYIRIFSDLSSQIRYSTQKRVLVEIALIKLCRPAMETNLDSVLDRLRVLEQRMDERPVQQVFVQPGATGNAGSTGIGSYGSAEAMAAAPEKAAPEDLQKIVASWKVIVGQTSGIFKQMLQKSIPKYNGQTGEPVLYIEFQDFLGKTYVDNPEAEEELKNIILAQTGKSVELKMVVAKEHNHTNLAKVTVDQALRENIHMDVVVEEDPDDAEE